MPVYADDFSYSEQLESIKSLNSIGTLSDDALKSVEGLQEAGERSVSGIDQAIAISNEAISTGKPVKAPSINPNVPFQFLGFNVISEVDGFRVSINFTGTIPDEYDSFRVNVSSTSSRLPANAPSYTTPLIPYDTSIQRIRLYRDGVLSDDIWSGDVLITSETGNITIGNNVETVSYLSSVQQVFSWLLDHVAELITFIMGNVFLAVSLFLFLCGAVISFFVKIKRA